jgi:HD superfamily phosphohydrolase
MEFEKIIRDPLLGYVHLTKNEVRLIDTSVFQRLRRIKQLANTDLVYPGAVHSRFEHSLGVLETAFRIAQRIPSINSDQDKMRQIRYAALLHDIGHGPYSHVFEDIIARTTNNPRFTHEMITQDILQIDDDIKSILGSDINGVLDLLGGSQRNKVEYSIISGPLDADKLDYLRRDSYHAGVAYGVFDATRVLYTLKEIKGKVLGAEESYLGADMKGREAIIGMLLAHYYMHEAVYSHKTRRIADAMLVRSAELALEEKSLDLNLFSYAHGDSDFIANFKLLDDRNLLSLLLKKTKGDAKIIAQRLRHRRLFKAVFGTDFSVFEPRRRDHFQRMELRDIKKLEEQIGEQLKKDPSYVIVDRQSIRNPLYREPGSIPPRAEQILLQDKNNRPVELSDVPSPISGATMKFVERLWVFVPVKDDAEKEKIGKEVTTFLSTW